MSDDQHLAAFQDGLLAWYAANGRDLPWRRTRDPYHILVSEMMLQQTQVPRVLPRYLRWLERFPTLEALAAAPTADVLREWSGLGYNSRAVRLQAIARHVVAHHGGRMPRTVEELLALPGIGDYTARAIACFAHEQDVPVLDTNVKRVLHRVLLGPEVPAPQLSDRQLWDLAARALPPGRGYDWNQALMDFGSQVCTARRPACLVCPLRPICRAAPTIHARLAEEHGASRRASRAAKPSVPFTSTSRYYRGQTLRVLGELGARQSLSLDALGPRVKPGYTPADRPWLYGLVAQLARDGLVSVTNAQRGARNAERGQAEGGTGQAESRGLPGGSKADGHRATFVREERAGYDVDRASGETAVPDLETVRVSLPEA